MAKTVKDLKIGDSVFFVRKYEIRSEKITMINGDRNGVCTVFRAGSHITCEACYSQIEDLSSFQESYKYSYMLHLERKDAILELKEKLASAINTLSVEIKEKLGEIESLTNELKQY